MTPEEQQLQELAQEVREDIARTREYAKSKDGGELGTALANVMEVVLRWRTDPDLVLLDVNQAATEITDAVRKGLQA